MSVWNRIQQLELRHVVLIKLVYYTLAIGFELPVHLSYRRRRHVNDLLKDLINFNFNFSDNKLNKFFLIPHFSYGHVSERILVKKVIKPNITLCSR